MGAGWGSLVLDQSRTGSGSNAESDGTNAQRTRARGDMPRRSPIHIHIRVALDVWFCDHSERWGVWLLLHLGRWALVWLVVGIFTYVCVCRILWVRDVAPPTVRSLESRSP